MNFSMVLLLMGLSWLISCANIDKGQYILAAKYILCRNDPNFRDTNDQMTILSLTINETNKLFQRTEINVFNDPQYSRMPEIAPYEVEFLDENSFLCSDNITLANDLYNKLQQMNVFSKYYPNILLFPNYINAYMSGQAERFYGYAKYGSAYIDDSQPMPDGRLLNIFFISTIIFRIRGFKSFYLLHQHEIGHGFVGMHDPENEHDSQHFGSHIMGSNFLSFQGENNQYFSRESINAIIEKIKNVIQRFHEWLYYGYKPCGNGILENEEECDTLRNTEDHNNFCDSKTCKLNTPYKCSPFNHRCCDIRGQIDQTQKECFHEEKSRCLKASFCTGIDHQCPVPEYFEKDTVCGVGKRCSSDGQCLFERCKRPEDECDCNNSCMTCCSIDNGTSCEALSAKLDGTPCITDNFDLGQCMNSKCSSSFIYDDDNDDKPEQTSSRTQSILYQIAMFIFTLILAIITAKFMYYFKRTKQIRKSEKIELQLIRMGSQANGDHQNSEESQLNDDNNSQNGDCCNNEQDDDKADEQDERQRQERMNVKKVNKSTNQPQNDDNIQSIS